MEHQFHKIQNSGSKVADTKMQNFTTICHCYQNDSIEQHKSTLATLKNTSFCENVVAIAFVSFRVTGRWRASEASRSRSQEAQKKPDLKKMYIINIVK